MEDSVRLTGYIENNELDKVKELLITQPAIIEGKHLFSAARCGDLKILRYLTEYSRVSLNERDESGRDVLHYCALSDSEECFDYLIRKCGMDPMAGDRDRITPWELAIENGSSKICAYMEREYGSYRDYYKNPIRTGMFPDPSIVRVGDDYYMVNSSFIFFPCIPVSHSKDLIHWEIIGHAITEKKWAGIDELEGGRGYWAPDISYYEGKFYITATLRYNDVPPVYRRQIVVSSDRPEGPYSEPAYIDEDGIDPSIFNDNDGRRYMLLNRGARILELDSTATRQISEAKLLYYGDMKRAPEGPHLYKRDGYYYLILAEGGTGTGHRVTVQRSKTLMGDYEPCPYNPIMRQTDEKAALQRCGHGDLTDTPDGRWYMVYLCGRMYMDKYSITGRETAIDPVTWTEDGWPVVNSLKGPSVLGRKPFPDMEYEPESRLRILPSGLPDAYMTPRTYDKDDIKVELSDDGKCCNVSLKPSAYPLTSIGCRSILLRRQTSLDCEFSADVRIDPLLTDGAEFGLTGYYDENTFLTFGVYCQNGRGYLRVREHIGDKDKEYLSGEPIEAQALDGDEADTVSLRMEVRGLKRNMYCNGKLFKALEDVYYLSDEGLSTGKRFTGAMLGVYAISVDSDIPSGHYREFTRLHYTDQGH